MKIQKILVILIILTMLLNVVTPVLATDQEKTAPTTSKGASVITMSKSEEKEDILTTEETKEQKTKNVVSGEEEKTLLETRETTEDEQTEGESGSLEKDDEQDEVVWADFSNAKFEFVDDTVGNFKKYNLELKNVKFNGNSNETYCIFISNSSTKPTMGATADEINDNCQAIITSSSSQYVISSTIISNYLEKKGDSLYIWVVGIKNVGDETVQKELVSAKKIEKPAQNKIGNRLMSYFFNYETSTFLYEPYYEENRKINVKIGKITDNKILLSIKNGEANCLENLMSYAKQASPVYTGTIKLGKSESVTDKFDVVDGAYYYVYMQMDDENGKYMSIEDVSLYQGLCSKSIGDNLFDYLSSEFKWNISEEPEQPSNPPKDGTTAQTPIPQTGETAIIVTLIAFVAMLGTVLYIKYNKYKDVK